MSDRFVARLRKPPAFAFSLLGLFVSLYLWWVYSSPARPIVCLGTGCDEVRASRFAYIRGVPLPIFGVGLYCILAVMILAEPLLRSAIARWLRRTTVIVAGAGFVASLGLSTIEAFVIRAWCAWCVTQAVAITLAFLLSLTTLRHSFPDRRSALIVVRHCMLILMIAIVAGAASFLWLTRHASSAGQQETVQVTREAAERLVRSDSHVTGNTQSPVLFVEFGDLQCPACVRVAPEVEELRRQFGDRVRFVFRQFPLDSMHEYALPAAEASECAGRQGKFWQAIDRFYAAYGILDRASLEHYAREIGLDIAYYRACMRSHETFSQIQADVLDGRALGVRSTPTFFIGNKRAIGVVARSELEQMVKAALVGSGRVPSTGASAAQ